MTPPELISALEKLGYYVSPRRVTDWLGKGLLPPLRQRGRGRGQGAKFYWSEPDIVAHAATVCDLLSLKSRTQPALLATWLVGYPVKPDLVRRAWLNSLGREQAEFDRHIERSGDVSPPHSHWAATLGRTWARQLGIERELLTDVFLEALSIIFERDYEFEPELYEDDFRIVADALLRANPLEMSLVTKNNLATAALLLNNTLTYEAVSHLVRTASDIELDQVHQWWLSLGLILHLVFSRAAPDFFEGQGLSPAKRIAIGIGRGAMLGLLHLKRSHHGARFTEVLNDVEIFCAENRGNFLFRQNQYAGNMDILAKPEFLDLKHRIWRLGVEIAQSITTKFGFE